MPADRLWIYQDQVFEPEHLRKRVESGVYRTGCRGAAGDCEGCSPGAVGLIVKDKKIIAHEALGNMQTHEVEISPDGKELLYKPMRVPMQKDTIFDLASLTKMVVAVPSILILMEQQKLDLDDPVSQHLPSFGALGKEKVTIRHLLTHSSGLPSWIALYQTCMNKRQAWDVIDREVMLNSSRYLTGI